MSSQLTRQRQRKQQVEKHSRKPIEEMVRNLKVEPSVKISNSNKVHSEDRSPSDEISSVSSSAGDAKTNIKEINGDHDSPATEQGLPAYPMGVYYGYYYAGYDGTVGGSDDKGFYAPVDGTGLQYPVMQADNGSFIYFMPGIPPAYSPYSEYMPTSLISLDGRYAGHPPYSPSHVFQPSIPSGDSPTPISYTQLVSSPHLWNPSSFSENGGYGNVYSGILEIPGSRPSMSSPSHVPCHPIQNLPYDLNNPLQVKGFPPDVSSTHGARLQSNRGLQYVSTIQQDLLGKGYFQSAKFPSYNQVKGGIVYPSSPGKSLVWGSTEKPRTRSKINGIGDIGMLNGHNHGPRTTKVKGALTYGGNLTGSLSTNGNGNNYGVAPVIRRDQYNLPDFRTKYDHALFFVIKSYSEDDIHKSIKYNVWASTPNGNKRLDGAYQDAQEKVAEKNSNCPVFLFFSVNASGQFCGLAEMVGRVDFNKSMDFWQQDKWNGYFPVKWHIIKDVPNPQLRHIILENNENKPVTNSRDTQEVPFPQGIEMLNLFKNYISKTSILDDFEFYESREKLLQEKRPRPFISQFDLRQKVDASIAGLHPIDMPHASTEETQIGDKPKK